MKVKLDENMSALLNACFAKFGHEAFTVADEGLAGRPDPVVLEKSSAEHEMLFTFDKNFADARRYDPGRHAGIVVLRLDDQDPVNADNVISEFLSGHDLAELGGCVVVISPPFIRIRRP